MNSLGFNGYRLPKYQERLLLLNMTTLSDSRTLASALFGFDLLRRNILCPELCDQMTLVSHSYNTRNRNYIFEHRTNYSLHNPINECIKNLINIVVSIALNNQQGMS